MSRKSKLKRFRENAEFPHVWEPTREELLKQDWQMKGKWAQQAFGNNFPLVLELGCGKGEYSLAMARRQPSQNFIGMDIKGARLWRGAKTVEEESFTNVGFIRAQIELIDRIFGPEEVSEIWLTFPDPQIKSSRLKHRLTNPEFLERYRKILKTDGLIHLKTDSEFLYGYTLGLLEGLGIEPLYAHHDIYKNMYSPKLVREVQTHYEKLFLAKGKAITYLCFKLNPL